MTPSTTPSIPVDHRFLKILGLLLVFMIILLPAPGHAEPPIQQMRDSTVFVVCTNANIAAIFSNISTGLTFGSGFIINDGKMVVTNLHVVKKCFDGWMVFIWLEREHYIRGKVIAPSSDKDLAIIELEKPVNRPSVTLAPDSMIRDLENVYAMGFPVDAITPDMDLDSFFVVKSTFGKLSAKVTFKTGIKHYQIDAALNPGNSGGPLFDEKGRVIGINVRKSLTNATVIDAAGGAKARVRTQRVPKGEGIAWAVSADELIHHLQAHDIPCKIARMTILEYLRSLSPVTLGAMGLGIMMGILWIISFFYFWRKGRIRKPAPVATPTPVPVPDPVPAPKQDVPVLCCLEGPYRGDVIPMETPVVIGRDPKICNLVISTEFSDVSNRHCKVYYDRQQRCFFLEDGGSTNGTFFASGERLVPDRPKTLQSGDRFYLVDARLTFEVRMNAKR